LLEDNDRLAVLEEDDVLEVANGKVSVRRRGG